MGAEVRWEMRRESGRIRGLCLALAGMILLALPAAAQMEVGDYLRMNLNGNVGFTYGGGINGGVSDHSMGFTGNGVLTGSYYNPNFLNFNVSPFYNRNQNNSIFGNITNTEGLSSNLNLFNGSHFPGSFSYNRSDNGISAFGVPGSDLGLAQQTNTQMFTVGWSALIPNWPTLNASYSIGSNANSILGESGTDTEKDRMLLLTSNYRWDGFTMSGQFQHRNTNADFTEFLQAGEAPISTVSSSNSYNATIQHPLPLSGSFGVSWSRLGYDYNYRDSVAASNSGNSDTVNGNAAFHPTNKLAVGFNTTYTDNLLGSIPETVLSTGTPVNIAGGETFHSFLVGSDAYYQLLKNLGIHANVAHEQQSFMGQTYSATQFGGSANFNFDHSLLQGLSFSFGMVDTAQQQNNTGLGFVGNLNYTRKFLGWTAGGNFSYAQNVQTVMLVYTTSQYSYLASLRRRIGERNYFMLGYSGSHSGISANSGTTSSANRMFASYIYRGNSLNAYYDKSNGMAILTANGLVPVPISPAPVVAPSAFTSYNSEGYGFSLGASPMRRLTVNGSFGKSHGSTIDPNLSVYTNNTLMTATVQYRMRKIYLNGGFTRLDQTVGTPGTSPLMVTSYYIGFSRWFNFF